MFSQYQFQQHLSPYLKPFHMPSHGDQPSSPQNHRIEDFLPSPHSTKDISILLLFDTVKLTMVINGMEICKQIPGTWRFSSVISNSDDIFWGIWSFMLWWLMKVWLAVAVGYNGGVIGFWGFHICGMMERKGEGKREKRDMHDVSE